ncbi:L,D-transpeptidase catalytic domain protein [Bradyrhizobium guangdongense]|nr:L,D-transpeptidase catalytic domain protein [Bradyrhizobium guangdongense]
MKPTYPVHMKKHSVSVGYAKKTTAGPLSAMIVKAAAGNPRRGWLTAGPLVIPVALGRGGILANKREGDGGTPKGSFRPRQLWWRGDRHSRPKTFLPVRTIKPEDAWCEDPGDRHYNQPIRLEREQGGDRLTRADHLYDFIIEIDHNTRPRIPGRGSAVFLHLARDNFGPTAGCVSMTRQAMLQLLRRMGPRTKIIIG